MNYSEELWSALIAVALGQDFTDVNLEVYEMTHSCEITLSFQYKGNPGNAQLQVLEAAMQDTSILAKELAGWVNQTRYNLSAPSIPDGLKKGKEFVIVKGQSHELHSFNDKVRIKLNALGEALLYQYGCNNSMFQQEDGYWYFQLHQIAHIFGSELRNGKDIPFDTTQFTFVK